MQKKTNAIPIKKKNPAPAVKAVKNPDRGLYFLCASLFATFLLYIGSSLRNQFTNWDDNIYVIENYRIHSFSPELFTSIINANWAPVHALLLAMQYHFFGLHPAGYHITSLLLHLCNTALVYLVIQKLSKKNIVAGIVALLFGIHPMHVESVAWASAQKDLLYTFFYLLAMLMYFRYRESKDIPQTKPLKYLLLTGLFFILSCLSKSMGTTLPVALVLIDCYQKDQWNWKFIMQSIWQKAIFFLLSLIFAVTAYVVLQRSGALEDTLNNSLPEQIMFSCYALIIYVVKSVLPLYLSPFYLYPQKAASGMYPVIYYLSPVIIIAALVAMIWYIRWSIQQKRSYAVLLFGIIFFLVNMILVLQVKTLNYTILAERYTYLSYVGIFFIVASGAGMFWEKYKDQFKGAMIGTSLLMIIILGIATYGYTAVWYDSISLWTNVIEHRPADGLKHFNVAYNNRGLAYMAQGKVDSAITDFSMAISLDPEFNYGYNNRGLAYARQGKTGLAIDDYTTIIHINPKFELPYYNRGLIYAHLGRDDLAIADYTQAIRLNPAYASAYNDRGLSYMRLASYDTAIADFSKAISLNDQFDLPYYNRGIVYSRIGKYEMALPDFDKALELNPQYVDIYNDRGWALARYGKPDRAMADFDTAIRMNPRFALPYFNRGALYIQMGDLNAAMADLDQSILLYPGLADAYEKRALIDEKMGRPADPDLQKAIELRKAH